MSQSPSQRAPGRGGNAVGIQTSRRPDPSLARQLGDRFSVIAVGYELGSRRLLIYIFVRRARQGLAKPSDDRDAMDREMAVPAASGALTVATRTKSRSNCSPPGPGNSRVALSTRMERMRVERFVEITVAGNAGGRVLGTRNDSGPRGENCRLSEAWGRSPSASRPYASSCRPWIFDFAYGRLVRAASSDIRQVS
jgi:hypothetical protein